MFEIMLMWYLSHPYPHWSSAYSKWTSKNNKHWWCLFDEEAIFKTSNLNHNKSEKKNKQNAYVIFPQQFLRKNTLKTFLEHQVNSYFRFRAFLFVILTKNHAKFHIWDHETFLYTMTWFTTRHQCIYVFILTEFNCHQFLKEICGCVWLGI